MRRRSGSRRKIWVKKSDRKKSASSSSASINDTLDCLPEASRNKVGIETLPAFLLESILAFLSHREVQQTFYISKEWSDTGKCVQTELHFPPSASLQLIRTVLTERANLRYNHVQEITFTKNLNINDEFMLWLCEHVLGKPRWSELRRIGCYTCTGIQNHGENVARALLQVPTHLTFDFDRVYSLVNPTPNVTAEEVVWLQLLALRDRRIDQCWKFASPGNQRATGPLSRFTRMIETGFPIMLNWDTLAVSQHLLAPGSNFIVHITKGEAHRQFLWIVTLQAGEEDEGDENDESDESDERPVRRFNTNCWMTDGVIPI